MVGQETIIEIAGKIAERFRPEKIILFGSHARGEATQDSDLDLLVVVRRPAPRGRRSAPIIKMLAEEYDLPIDVIVRSGKALERWSGVPGTLSHQIAQEGVILYERRRSRRSRVTA